MVLPSRSSLDPLPGMQRHHWKRFRKRTLGLPIDLPNASYHSNRESCSKRRPRIGRTHCKTHPILDQREKTLTLQTCLACLTSNFFLLNISICQGLSWKFHAEKRERCPQAVGPGYVGTG